MRKLLTMWMEDFLEPRRPPKLDLLDTISWVLAAGILSWALIFWVVEVLL